MGEIEQVSDSNAKILIVDDVQANLIAPSVRLSQFIEWPSQHGKPSR